MSNFQGLYLPVVPRPYEDMRKPSSGLLSALVREEAKVQGCPETVQPQRPLSSVLRGWVLSGQHTRMCTQRFLRLSHPKLLGQRLIQEGGVQMGKWAKTCSQVSPPPLPPTPGVVSLPPGGGILSPCPLTPRKGYPHPNRERSFREALKGHVSAASSWPPTKLRSQ